MMAAELVTAILKSIITLFIIVDPFASAAFFIGFAQKSSVEERNKAILTAIIVAAIIMFSFLFLGLAVLGLLNISFEGFKIAGGLILLVLGATTVLGIELGGAHRENMKSAAILIATPLLSGPGTIATIIVLSKDYGYLVPAIACVIILAVSYIILRLSFRIHAIVGSEVIGIMSKVMGLLLAALAVDYIYSGVVGIIAGAV